MQEEGDALILLFHERCLGDPSGLKGDQEISQMLKEMQFWPLNEWLGADTACLNSVHS